MDHAETSLLLNAHSAYCLYANYPWINRDICISNSSKWKTEPKTSIFYVCVVCVQWKIGFQQIVSLYSCFNMSDIASRIELWFNFHQ